MGRVRSAARRAGLVEEETSTRRGLVLVSVEILVSVYSSTLSLFDYLGTRWPGQPHSLRYVVYK